MILPYIPDTNNLLLRANLQLLATRGKPQADFVNANISEFKQSEAYQQMGIAENYFKNKTDILEKRRKAINENGQLIEDLLLPNNILNHSYFRNIVDEKAAYVFAKPFTIKTNNDKFQTLLDKEIFTDALRQRIKLLAKDAYKKGISYLQPTFDKDGKLYFKFRPGNTIVPFWNDEDHTQLDAFILFYKIKIYEKDGNSKEIDYAEFVDNTGVYRYTIDAAGKITPNEVTEGDQGVSGHFSAISAENEIQEVVWEKLPLIAFKANADEYPIIQSVKRLIDAYDTGTSDLADAIGDLPYSIKVVVNYDGQDLGELAKNLYTYRIVNVTDAGDLKSLQQTIDINSINGHLDRLKDDIYECGRIVNDKNAVAVNASGKALDRLYNKIDIDANDLIAEFNASLEQLIWFVKWYYKYSGVGDFTGEEVEFVFNTDKPTDETTVIQNCVNSKGIISDETIIANHPWVTDLKDELDKLKKQREQEMNELLNMPAYGADNTNETNSSQEAQQNEEESTQEE